MTKSTNMENSKSYSVPARRYSAVPAGFATATMTTCFNKNEFPPNLKKTAKDANQMSKRKELAGTVTTWPMTN